MKRFCIIITLILSVFIIGIQSYNGVSFAAEVENEDGLPFSIEVYGTFGDGLPLLGEPDYQSDGSIRIPEGEILVIDKTHYHYGHTDYNNYEGWIDLQFTKTIGESGYIKASENMEGYGNYIVLSSPTGLAMRTEPVFSSSIIGIIPKNENVLVEGTSFNYGYVKYEDKYGWVSMNYLQPEERYLQAKRVPGNGDLTDQYIGKSFRGTDPWNRETMVKVLSLDKATGRLVWTLRVNMGQTSLDSAPVYMEAEMVSYLDNTRLGSFDVYNIYNHLSNGYNYYSYTGAVKLIDNHIELTFYNGECGSVSEEGGGAAAFVMNCWDYQCILAEGSDLGVIDIINLPMLEQSDFANSGNNYSNAVSFPENLIGRWKGSAGVELTISEDGTVEWVHHSSIDNSISSGYLGKMEGTTLILSKRYSEYDHNPIDRRPYSSMKDIPDEYLSESALVYNLTIFSENSFSATNVDPREYPYSFIRTDDNDDSENNIW